MDLEIMMFAQPRYRAHLLLHLHSPDAILVICSLMLNVETVERPLMMLMMGCEAEMLLKM